MITSEHRTPFEACVTCLNQPRCPLMTTGAGSRISVPKPHECLMDQLQPGDLEGLARQLDNNIGLNKIQYEQLGRQLEFVLQKMEDMARKIKVIPGK